MSTNKIEEALDRFEQHIEFEDEPCGSCQCPINPDWQLLEDARDELAALAPPAPHIVDTVEGLEAMPAGSALLDSRGGVILIEDPTVHLSESARAVLRDLAPFTVLHVGGAE